MSENEANQRNLKLNNSMKKNRKKIDLIDREIVSLLAKRQKCVVGVRLVQRCLLRADCTEARRSNGL